LRNIEVAAAMEGAGKQQDFKYGRINMNSAWARSRCLFIHIWYIIIANSIQTWKHGKRHQTPLCSPRTILNTIRAMVG